MVVVGLEIENVRLPPRLERVEEVVLFGHSENYSSIIQYGLVTMLLQNPIIHLTHLVRY